MALRTGLSLAGAGMKSLGCIAIERLLGIPVEKAVKWAQDHFADHSKALQKAMSKANDRTWSAIESALTPKLLFGGLVDFRHNGDFRARRDAIASFFKHIPEDILANAFQELINLRASGLLNYPIENWTVGEPFSQSLKSEQALLKIVEAFGSQSENLIAIINIKTEQQTSLFLETYILFLKREISKNEVLSRELNHDAQIHLSAQIQTEFENLVDLLADGIDRIESRLDDHSRENRKMILMLEEIRDQGKQLGTPSQTIDHQPSSIDSTPAKTTAFRAPKVLQIDVPGTLYQIPLFPSFLDFWQRVTELPSEVQIEPLTAYAFENWGGHGLADFHFQKLSELKDELPLWQFFSLSNGEITNDGFDYLKEITSLRSLRLHGCGNLTDAGLVDLKKLTNLQVLELRGCERITDEGLVHLRELVELVSLKLSGEQLTGAGLSHFKRLKSLETLSFGTHDKVNDSHLVNLKNLENLGELDLSDCATISDAGLVYIGALPKLYSLDLSECSGFTDGGIVHLQSLTKLRSLNLGACEQLSDAGFAHLALMRELFTLDLSDCKNVTEMTLMNLRCLEKLRIFNLGGCAKIADVALRHLRPFTKLMELTLSGCDQITDDGLSHIAGLTALNRLDLSSCNEITDEGLRHLESLTSLNKLDLSSCEQISDKGVDRLQSVIANLEVSR